MTLLLGVLGFVLITVFEQLPVLGWLGWAVSIAAWIFLSDRLRRVDRGSTSQAAMLGAITGFVGALSSWIAQIGNLFGPDTGSLARLGAGFGFIGALLGILYWPLIGAAVCWIVAVARPRGRVPAELSTQGR
ncbi:MAG: hypothetical protein ABR525_05320 [Candidatus Limnocylindria bacterium]